MQYIPKISQLFSLIGYIIGSWILVHIMAVFGFFLSAAYPIWWLFFPKRTLCLFCRFGQEAGVCSVCRHPVEPEQLYPKTFTSVWINAFTFAALTTFFVGVILVEGMVISRFLPSEPTVYFSIPTKGQYQVGEKIDLLVELRDIRQAINVVQSDITFDPQALHLENIATENSFATLFVQKEVNNDLGYARLVGGVPNPGFSGNLGVFATFQFVALTEGITEVTFLPTSLVLANNGKGTNLLKEYGAVNYLILPKTEQTVMQERENQAIELSSNSIELTTKSEQLALGPKLELYDSFSVVLGSKDATAESNLDSVAVPTVLERQEKPSMLLRIVTAIHRFDVRVIEFYKSIW